MEEREVKGLEGNSASAPETAPEVKKRKIVDTFKGFLTKNLTKNRLIYIGLILIVLLGVFIRVQNMDLLKDQVTGEYTPLALDPYYFLRIARDIVSEGELFEWDEMRYYPVGVDPNRENIFLSHMIIFTFKLMKVVYPAATLELADVLYPVIFFALSTLVFFFLIKEMFGKKIALLSTLLLTIMPAYLYRTMAGFADKESLGLFFMFLAFYFYVKALKTEKTGESVFFGLLAGGATGFMGLSWGGFKFLLVIIALFNLTLFFLNKIGKKELYVYLSWIVPFSAMLMFLTTKYGGVSGVLTSTTTGIAYLTAGLLLFNLAVEKVKIFQKIKLPQNIITLIVIFILATIVGSIAVGGMSVKGLSLISIAEDAKNMLTSGGFGTNRFSLTVAENKQPFITTWIDSFRLLFPCFLAGIIIFFYKLVSHLEKYRKKLTIIFALFLACFVFSRYSPNSILNGENAFSNIVYFGSILVFGLILLGLFFYFYYKDKESYKDILSTNKFYLFFFAWFIVMIVAGRSAIRLLMMLSPVIAVLASYFFIKMFVWGKKISDKVYKTSAYVGILLVLVFIILSNTSVSFASAKATGPSYNYQWQYSMDWVKQNTPQDSVFAHWWDYGYWVQTGADRATITDGGNYYSYWNHLMGRHVLSAKSEDEALEFLKVHDASHLLIISDEIGKYTAYSSIGSDENFDIFSWISTFVMDPRANTKEGDVITYFFYGGTGLDENFVYDNKVFPEKKAYIGGFLIPVKEGEDDYEILQPKALLYYQGQKTEVPVECVYDGEKKFFNETGLPGCIRIMPRILPGFQYQQENGALLWVSRKGTEALWTKLFLFDEESENFELVFDDSGKNKLAYYNGNVMGPLKIWKINYPENLTVSKEVEEKYLALNTPEWLQLSGITI